MKTHLQIAHDNRNAQAIVCGPPERAKWMASLLEDSEILAQNREYHSYRGVYEGMPILITSHGVGSAGAAICFQELVDAGAKKIVRIGTAGGLFPEATIGDIVIPTGAIRQDGVSSLMIPKEYPAVPDHTLTEAIFNALESSPRRPRCGIVLTSDLFYPGKLGTDWAFYREAGAKAVEMECSALFVAASLRGIQSAAILVLDGNPLNPGDYDPNPERLASSFEISFHAAVRALSSNMEKRE